MRCKLCGNELNGMLCPLCGYDHSQNRELFPTLADDGMRPMAVWKIQNLRYQEAMARQAAYTPPYGQAPAWEAGQPYGQAPARVSGQPYGQAPAWESGQPYGQAPAREAGQPYGQAPARVSGQPYGQAPAREAGQPYGQAPAWEAGQPYGQAPAWESGQPYGQAPAQPGEAEEKPPKKKKALWLIPVAAALLALGIFIGQGPLRSNDPGGSGGQTPATESQRATLLPSLWTQAATAEPAATEGRIPSGSFDITVWVPDAAYDLTEMQIAAFNADNTYGLHFNANISAVSDADAPVYMLSDVGSGADLYIFAQDQFAPLVRGGALNQLPSEYAAAVAAENTESAVEAGRLNGVQYAYPLTNDNGYFLYYDKSVIPESDVDSLEKLIADCEAAGRYFCMENETCAWYLASWFFAVGCHSDWITDDDGSIISFDDDFNSDKGLIAVRGMKKLLDSGIYRSSSSADEFRDRAAIVVTGTWAYEAIKSVLGSNLGAADLPSFEVDGQAYHMGSFSGCRLLGVKPQGDSDRLAALHVLARYLSGEAAQYERLNALYWGPANRSAAASDVVLDNPALAALIRQNEYAVPQGIIGNSWWDIAKVIAYDAQAATDEAGLRQALRNYDAKLTAAYGRSEAERNAWGVIGGICGTSWDQDFPMTDMGSGIYESETLRLNAGEMLKCRKGATWDVNFPEYNVVVPRDGAYIVRLDVNAGTVELIAQ